MNANTISHKATNSFSKLVIDYLTNTDALKPFYQFEANLDGMKKAIEARKKYPVDRKVVTDVLQDQYKNYELSPELAQQIELLKSEHTFTVCTAHQPDLMTGYLYFFYKIIHTAKLAHYLKENFPENDFVPIFYIGSEDNDIDELSIFHYEGKIWRWQTKQTGAVGRMSTEDLKPMMLALIDALIPPGENRHQLSKIISAAYDGKNTIAQAIRHIVHCLLGHLGILVIDADDERLKRCYLPVMKDELLNSKAESIVQATSARLNQHYNAQAYARPINLFYLKDNIRERIEKKDAGWQVINTNIFWQDEEALLKELESHPERFSPNVILRGPYQECILPDVAFIGGGSEVAYWMQLKGVYEHYNIFFPTLILRQSALWMTKEATRLQNKLQLNDEDLFKAIPILEKEQVLKNAHNKLSLAKNKASLQEIIDEIKIKATVVDSTLNAAAEALKAKMGHLADNLEKKMLRAEKRHFSDKMRQIEKLKSLSFPNNTLQERYNNFLELYLQFGESFTQVQYDNTLPFGDRFVIVKEN